MRHKPLINNLSLIRWLMILSQFMLVVFAAQWLLSEYRKEQSRLNREMAACFREVEEEVTDSVLKVTVIDPLIRERFDSVSHLQITLNSQGTNDCSWTESPDTTLLNIDREVMSVATVKGHLVTDTQIRQKKILVLGSDQAMLRGVKLMIRGMEDSLMVREGSSFFYRRKGIDSATIRDRFMRKTGELYPIARFQWESVAMAPDGMTYSEKPFEYLAACNSSLLKVRLDNPVRLVVGSMIAAILFSLVVVLFTAVSMVLAFRSLKKQLLLNRLRAGMVSNITHELKTPVSTVKVALEALSRFDLKQDPLRSEEYLSMAARELERLELLVNQVLNAAVYEQGNLVLNPEPVDLPELIRHALEGCRPQLERHNATVTLTIAETFGQEPVEADPLHLQGVLINLIDNSLKHGGERPAITLDLSRTDKEIILRYSNNGPAIPETYLDRIFERFFRVPDGDRHDTKGFGLGLSYAAMVMQLHGGGIRAENNPAGGVSFILRIPVKPS